MTDVTLVPGRSCDGCTLCCKLMAIRELQKPRLAECSHCHIGVGCRIYTNRPAECAEFYCSYRLDPNLGEEWRPADCKIVVAYDRKDHRINVCVDPSLGDGWREAPYYDQIKAMATNILNARGHLIVWQGADGIGILPHKEVFLGPPQPNQVVVAGRATGEFGEEFVLVVMDQDDPRLANL
jgi:hypothetical protein